MGLGPRPRPALNKNGAGIARTESIPASTRGLNARDSISEMPPDMALQLQNIFPNPSDMQVRACDNQFWDNGFNAATPIYSLMEYRPASGARKLFATASTLLYDVTTPPAGDPLFNVHGTGYIQIGSAILTGSELTGYVPATTYTADITIDGGGAQHISVLGSNATTINALIGQLNGLLAGATASLMSTFSIYGRNKIVIRSASTGSTSNVVISDTGANHLFSSITNFFGIGDHNADPRLDGTAASVTGLTSGTQWQWINVANGNTSCLFAANGSDNMRRYDTVNGWKDVSTAGAWQITGLTASAVNNMALIHHRLFFTQNSSAIVYYLGADAIAGAATALDLGGIFDKGGAVVAIGGWTMADSGVGVQEFTVFVTDKGQAAVYQGYDPTNQALWQLSAVYNVGAPVGQRCLLKYSNELLLLTTDGLVPASKAFVSDRTNQRIALTTNIQDIVASDITQFGATTLGWTLAFWPEAQHLIINVPTADNIGQQLVMNTIHNAWCVYTGWAANDMLTARPASLGITNRDSLIYCDSRGNITYVDAVDFENTTNPNIGKDIMNGDCTIIWQPSFNSLSGGRFRTKEVSMIRPNLVYNTGTFISLLAGIDYDFVSITPSGVVTLPTITGGGGGGQKKTGPNVGASPRFRMVWLNMSAVGIAIAPHFQMTCEESLHFDAIDVVFTLGGIQSS